MNSLTIKPSAEIQPLIEAIRQHDQEEIATTGAIALINLIPFAGGAIAAVVGEVASQRRFEKVCDVLSDLNGRLEAHGANPEEHLSKDQIIEVVHETLQTVTTASDQKKIEALKNGLAYTFLADDRFDRKQLLLQVLRGCTVLELTAMVELYDAADPFVTREPRQPIDVLWTSPSASQLLAGDSSRIKEQAGHWNPIGNTDKCGQESLLTFLSKRIDIDEGSTEGALRLLDGKGLAKAGPNLSRRDCKVLRWTRLDGSYLAPNPALASSATASAFLAGSEIRPTPLEASRTEFGQDFLRFCRNA
ncbi:MAG: hypothetical protein ACXWID_19955 [Pyrinomonadaceae bacterium]